MLDATVNRKVISFEELPLEVQELLIQGYPKLVKEVECMEFNFHSHMRDSLKALGFDPYRGQSELYTVEDLLEELEVAVPNLEKNTSVNKEYPGLVTYLKNILEKAKTLPKNLKVEVSL